MLHRFSFLEQMLLRFDVLPHPFVDAGASMGLTHALAASVRLGLVDHLSSEPQPLARLAQRAGLSEQGSELVLDCLDALGYVRQGPQGYAFTTRGTKFLAPDSPEGLRYFILFSDWIQRGYVEDLDRTIRAGRRTQGTMLDTLDERGWELFSRAMIEISRTNREEVVGLLTLPKGAKTVLDVGGSHGQYSISLCKKHPGLSARVLDLPPVRRYMDECVRREEAAAMVQFVEGDFDRGELPGGNDVVLAFNIIHGLDVEGNRRLFRKAHGALNPGGTLFVLDQIKGTGGSSQLSKATTSFMALNLLHQAGGRTYTAAEVDSFAREAGFKGSSMKKLRGPGFAVIACPRG